MGETFSSYLFLLYNFYRVTQDPNKAKKVVKDLLQMLVKVNANDTEG